MTDIDVSKIKPGDVVGVRVVRTNPISTYPFVETGFGLGAIAASAIVSHTPAPRPALKVGDRVMDLDRNDREVIWIEYGRVYLRPRLRDQGAPYGLLSEVETWERLP